MKKTVLLLTSIALSMTLAAQWTSSTSGVTATLNSVSIASADTMYCTGGSGIILRTIDGASTWGSQTSGVTSTLYDIDFHDNNNGLCVGRSGKVLKTFYLCKIQG